MSGLARHPALTADTHPTALVPAGTAGPTQIINMTGLNMYNFPWNFAASHHGVVGRVQDS